MSGKLHTVEDFSNLFRPPTDEKIWRYMSFVKFVNMLHTCSLFFSKASMFEDKYEGIPPKITEERIKESISGSFGERVANEHMNSWRQQYKLLSETTYVSSWFKGDDESFLMWKSYGLDSTGVAIQSTFRRLVHSVCLAPRQVTVADVRYVDFENDEIPPYHWWFFLQKRNYFSAENEIRALLMNPDEKDDLSCGYVRTQAGIYVKVILEELIQCVHVPPLAQPWFVDTVQGVLDAFNLNVPIKHSPI